MSKKTDCENMPVVGSYCLGLVGLEFHAVYPDEVLFTYTDGTIVFSYHRCKVYYNRDGEPYFNFAGSRVYLSDCIITY